MFVNSISLHLKVIITFFLFVTQVFLFFFFFFYSLSGVEHRLTADQTLQRFGENEANKFNL